MALLKTPTHRLSLSVFQSTCFDPQCQKLRWDLAAPKQSIHAQVKGWRTLTSLYCCSTYSWGASADIHRDQGAGINTAQCKATSGYCVAVLDKYYSCCSPTLIVMFSGSLVRRRQWGCAYILSYMCESSKCGTVWPGGRGVYRRCGQRLVGGAGGVVKLINYYRHCVGRIFHFTCYFWAVFTGEPRLLWF